MSVPVAATRVSMSLSKSLLSRMPADLVSVLSLLGQNPYDHSLLVPYEPFSIHGLLLPPCKQRRPSSPAHPTAVLAHAFCFLHGLHDTTLHASQAEHSGEGSCTAPVTARCFCGPAARRIDFVRRQRIQWKRQWLRYLRRDRGPEGSSAEEIGRAHV